LQHILGKPTGLAFIGVNWHGDKTRISSCKAFDYKALAFSDLTVNPQGLENPDMHNKLHHQQTQHKTYAAVHQCLKQAVGAFLLSKQLTKYRA